VREFGRSKVFVETKVPGCGNPAENTTRNPLTCYRDAKANLATDLEKLGLDRVDLVILHFPPFSSFVTRSCSEVTGCCAMAREQWKALEEFYYEGKATAIGVSNYCPSVFECLKNSTTFPMVNQVMYHVGAGTNHAMQELQAYHKAHGVVTQGYSTLGNTPWTHHASADILHGNLTSAIAKKHNVSTVQVALKWVINSGVAAVTKSSNPAHLESDLDLWSWDLDAHDMAQLDDHKSADSPSYPSFACSK